MTVPSDAALIDDLTTIVSQAAAAILAVRAERAQSAHQGRPIAGHRRRRCLRSHHSGRASRGCCRACRSFRRRQPTGTGQRLGRRRLHPGRSGRRHARIGGRPRRIHDQSGACAGRFAGPRDRRRARARTGLAHGAERRRRTAPACPRRCGGCGDRASPRSRPVRCRAAGIIAAVSRSHFDPATRGVPGAACARWRRHASGQRIGDQALPRRRGRSRRLSPSGADPSVGRRRRPRHPRGRRRHRHHAGAVAAVYRPAGRRPARPRLHRLGRPVAAVNAGR